MIDSTNVNDNNSANCIRYKNDYIIVILNSNNDQVNNNNFNNTFKKQIDNYALANNEKDGNAI